MVSDASASVFANSETGAEPPHLEIRDLGMQRNGKWLFRHLTWRVPRTSVVAIVGPSGVGKSSLLSCLAGFTKPTEGELSFCCNAGCFHDAPNYQKRVGIIFQNFLLSQNSSLLRNVTSGRLGRYPWWRTLVSLPRADKVEAVRLMRELGLGEYVHRRAADISGGEQQRTAIARALFQEPELLLADEPVSNLDADLCGRVLGILRQQAHEQMRTVMCVLHDAALVERFADYAISLDPTHPENWRVRKVNAAAA